jgi:hypothetical protein
MARIIILVLAAIVYCKISYAYEAYDYTKSDTRILAAIRTFSLRQNVKMAVTFCTTLPSLVATNLVIHSTLTPLYWSLATIGLRM